MTDFGNSIEDYEFYEQVGKGGFASVHRAVCKTNGVAVAIKMINKKMMQAAGMVNRVRQEVAIHSRLSHPSILQLHAFFEDSDFVYLVLDLCENGEFQRYLKSLGHPLSEDEAREVMNQLLEGMLYLHSHNILHRDLSLANLLLTKEMKIKIADFGLATQLTRPDEKHMTMCGTPNYISPEVATRSSHGFEADVWGLGCLLYTLLVGRPPFDTDAVKSTLTRVVMADYKLPVTMSAEAKDLIQRLLKKNPKERPTLDEVMEHPFMNKRNRNDIDSGLFTMSTVPSLMTPSIKVQPPMLPKLRRCNSNREINTGPILALPKSTSTSNKNSTHSLPDGRMHSEMRNRQVQSWGEPCIETALPTAISRERQCDDPCGRHSCHHNPCQHSFNNRSTHCSHHSPCQSICSHAGSCQCHAAKLPKANPVNPSNRSRCLNELTPPLSTARLKATRQRTKNAVCSILDQGEICLEFIRTRSGAERIVDVCRISGDGMRIVLYQPNNGKGIPVADVPPPLPSKGSDAIYCYENLPSEHWKKYLYASRFVSLVKAKTPKVILYSDRAKCLLMENGPNADFEALFYSGWKMTRTTNGLQITEPNGQMTTLTLKNEEPHLDRESIRDLWHHLKECLAHCERVEEVVNQLASLPIANGSLPFFPITIGRKPMAPSSNKQSCSNKENQVTEPVLSGLKSFDGSVRSAVNNSGKSASLRRLDQPKLVNITRTVEVSGIGRAIQKSSGDVEVHFNDGSRIAIAPNSSTVVFSPSEHSSAEIFNTKEALPDEVRHKLSLVPKAVEQLVMCNRGPPQPKYGVLR
ncbi:serine/threonine-protein kinase PLK4-like [Daphnia carinata]|uniref:serine/threonine-protein kinase PLK4-like n=1 Tax=Daphnia carinata TaxID=120202 RepID=UPI0028696A55|nr:serine/threonine-protein kinase PLK4-like [Daphnia carinata]